MSTPRKPIASRPRIASFRRRYALVLGTIVLLGSAPAFTEPAQEAAPVYPTVGADGLVAETAVRTRPPIVNPHMIGLLAILAGASQSR